jgi:hypothetical protein
MSNEDSRPKSGKGAWIGWFIGILAAGGVITAVVNFVLPKIWPENAPPQPAIEAAGVTENYVLTGKEIVFDGTKSLDPEGKVLDYTWKIDPLGDDALGNKATLRWTFQEPGTYVVRLTVVDPEGLTVSDSKIITVQGSRGTTEPPSANTRAVSVPATFSSGRNLWFDTNFDVAAGSVLSITAKGRWTLGTGARTCDANGLQNFPDYNGFLYGTLLGRIGDNGKVFDVGSDYRNETISSGRLYLSNNDSNTEDNSGELEVTILSWTKE